MDGQGALFGIDPEFSPTVWEIMKAKAVFTEAVHRYIAQGDSDTSAGARTLVDVWIAAKKFQKEKDRKAAVDTDEFTTLELAIAAAIKRG